MNENNMISIDTSNGFLGFNTIDPSYHIDVVGGKIRSGNLIVLHDASINNTLEVSNNLILNNIPDIDNSQNVPLKGIYYDASGFLKIKL
jgi:hypothetical protein